MAGNEEVLVQGTLSSRVPNFCTHPTWFISGVEKRVKIGSKSFNYIDYLEAWEHHDCGTHRGWLALAKITDKIKEAFAEIEAAGYSVKR